MLIWEDRERFGDTKAMAEEIEALGAEIVRCGGAPAAVLDNEQGRYWFKFFKRWEYPFACWWLAELQQRLGKSSLKILDFGCWLSPFPEYLARHGHAVWGADDDSWGHIRQCDVRRCYPNVRYCIGAVQDMTEGGFDAVLSCSVLEHITTDLDRVEALKCLRRALAPEGRMLHLVDFYFPEKPFRDNQRMDFYRVALAMGFPLGDLALCPGAPEFDLNRMRRRGRFLYPHLQECRIALGDDLP